MTGNAYIEALSKIPKGETRTFGEIAALAGRPSGARAAGRAVSACPADARTPWHRAVTADGGLSIDPARATIQLERLRKEGARPREGESIARWARRTKAAVIGDWKRRRFAGANSDGVDTWDPVRVERFTSAVTADSRGFSPANAGRVSTRREPKAAPAPRPLRDAPLSAFTAAATGAVQNRLNDVNWKAAVVALRQMGAFVAPDVVPEEACEALAAMWDEDARFERTIEMAPRGYGIGAYRYWKEPVPSPGAEIRARVYAELRELASEHAHAPEFPRQHADFLALGHAAGQERASCILLRYEKGGVNHPHRDIYGPVWFPYQALVVLSQRDRDFRGGEFALYDREVNGARIERTFPLDQGDLCLFASRTCRRFVRHRERWVDVEHGMTPVTAGVRFALGLVLHPAQ